MSAFERHRWYAQPSLSNIAVYRIPVDKATTFAICIHGFVDDGWDNAGDWIEIYDREGVLVGSALIPSDYEWRRWKWLNRPLQGDELMATRQRRYSKEELPMRGQELYEAGIRQQVEAGNEGKIVAITSGRLRQRH